MKKNHLILLTLTIFAFPQIALAHFETPHELFWHTPLHFLVQHYQGLILIAAGLVAVIIFWKKRAERE